MLILMISSIWNLSTCGGWGIDLAAPAGMPLRVLHLGSGGLTLAR